MRLNQVAATVHTANMKWWQDPATQQPIKRNRGELIALMHSELSEGSEGEWEGKMDDKLPHRKMGEVEMVDALIRIFDYAAGFGYDLEGIGPDGLSEFTNLNQLPVMFIKSSEITRKLSDTGIELLHCKLSALLEHERKGRVDAACQAIVDAIAHISIYCALQGYDIQGAFDEKMAFNAIRVDHTHEARKIADGKQF